MIVVCIDNNHSGIIVDLTKSKQYNVISLLESKSFYRLYDVSACKDAEHYYYDIINDNGKEFCYDSKYFISLEEYRANQINKIL